MATLRKTAAQTAAFVYTCPYCGERSNDSLCRKRECRRKHYAEGERRRAAERARQQNLAMAIRK